MYGAFEKVKTLEMLSRVKSVLEAEGVRIPELADPTDW